MSKLFTIEFYKYFYEKILTKERTEKEINFLKIFFNKSDKILDLACGFWRHTEELLKIWYNVKWIDFSENFINFIKNKSKFKKNYFFWDIINEIKIWLFDKIYCLHTSFWYFSDKENEKIIKNISNILNENWLFILDLNNPYNDDLFKNWETKLIKWTDYIIDKKKVKWNKLYFNRIIKKWEIKYIEKYFLRIYFDYELEKIAKKYNLNLIKKIWDFNNLLFNNNSKRMILVFQKNNIIKTQSWQFLDR